MYFVILHNQMVIGPFSNRELAYDWAGKHDYSMNEYLVKSATVCQQNYLHLPIIKPETVT